MKRRSFLATLFLARSMPALGWAKPQFSVALLSGELRDGLWLAGLSLIMEEGWKTYWRIPGDAGVPPDFNFSKSANVKTVQMRWPAPQRYEDAAGETIGYKSRVVFPLIVTPQDPATPVTLSVEAFFGMCKDVCIPASANTSLELKADADGASMIQSYDSHVPVPGTWARSASVVTSDAQLGLMLTVAQDLPDDADIFVEGYDSAYFRAPRKSGGGYLLPIDGLKSPDDLKGKTLKLTLVASDKQLEQSLAVD